MEMRSYYSRTVSPTRLGLVIQAVFTLHILVAASARAQPTTAASGSQAEALKLTWQNIVRLVDQHPCLAAGQFRVAAAEGAVTTAGAVPNPSLDATLGHGEAREGSQSRLERGLEITLPLGWIAQRGHKVDGARAVDAENVVEEGSRAFAKKTKVEVVVTNDMASSVVEIIARAAHTGKPGDGKIFVYEVSDVVRIRTGERGEAAI
jgi:nitrogen regulatory protein P-II 1